ncbi:MAG: COX15/CtaA family protein [Verrucomicrobia bacterium]|nr:COX15/CtaA family protein [Verrucomicrobiota bacterium]
MASPAPTLPQPAISAPPLAASGHSTIYQPGLAAFAWIAFVWIFFIIYKGAFTTSIGAGMVFPDWPLSNGSLNPTGWLQDQDMLAEHGHRLAAGVMTVLCVVLAFWLQRVEPRVWLRRLGWAALGLVFFQAVVGGLRVLLDHLHVEMVNTSMGRLFAMVHACLAQLFLCTIAAIAVACSRPWLERGAGLRGPPEAGLRRLARWSFGLLFAQLTIAAVMRHSFAGMAIPTFPYSTPEGDLLPATWSFAVGIQFAHRAMAAVLTVVLIALAAVIWRSRSTPGAMRLGAAALLFLLALQIFLGAATVLSGRSPYYATWHVIVGASLLVTTFLIVWVLHRDLVEKPSAA